MNDSKCLMKGMIVLSILFIFLIIGAASAANENVSNDIISTSNDADDVVSVEVNHEQVSADNINTITGSTNSTLKENNLLYTEINDENKLNANNDELLTDEEYKPLSDLDTLIKVTPNSLLLSNNYKYVDSVLTINKNNMVIDFNGHILDANGCRGTFLIIKGQNVTIKNMKLINTNFNLISLTDATQIGRAHV